MGSFKTLLVELSKDPAMILWLDNHDNHTGAINENYGRELLELFSMGVGNYSEQDIKECARSFTGWTIGNTRYMETKSRRDSVWPYGRIAWHFEYRPEDHDDGEKEFLGQRGRFNGEDVIDIICQQPATARFISRHMYHFFVADEPPVPQWPYEPPRDPEAIEMLSRAYFDSNHDIRYMLRLLFTSGFFRSKESRYAKVKSPAELMAGVLRLTGEFEEPRFEMPARALQMGYMGQQLINPPSVEGWRQGTEWIDSGTLMERINFATEQLGARNNPGVKAMIDAITAEGPEVMSPERLVEVCLDQTGAISVSPGDPIDTGRFRLERWRLAPGGCSNGRSPTKGGGHSPDGRSHPRIPAQLGLIAQISQQIVCETSLFPLQPTRAMPRGLRAQVVAFPQQGARLVCQPQEAG